MTGLELQTCEKPGANVKFEERRLCLMKEKSRFNGTGMIQTDNDSTPKKAKSEPLPCVPLASREVNAAIG